MVYSIVVYFFDFTVPGGECRPGAVSFSANELWSLRGLADTKVMSAAPQPGACRRPETGG
jgi:hypothetical protein